MPMKSCVSFHLQCDFSLDKTFHSFDCWFFTPNIYIEVIKYTVLHLNFNLNNETMWYYVVFLSLENWISKMFGKWVSIILLRTKNNETAAWRQIQRHFSHRSELKAQKRPAICNDALFSCISSNAIGICWEQLSFELHSSLSRFSTIQAFCCQWTDLI